MYIHVGCRMTDRRTDQKNYILDVHWVRLSSPNISAVYLEQ